jgi:branched-chain amino acid transport system permease protein
MQGVAFLLTTIEQLVINGVVFGLIYVILALGNVLLLSVSGIFLLSYGMMYMIGAYAVWGQVVYLKIPYIPALIIASIACFIIGLITYRLIFYYASRAKRKFMTVVVAAMGLMLAMQQSSLMIFGTTPKSIPSVFKGMLNFGGLTLSLDKLVMLGIALIITLSLFFMYEKTRLGRGMRAVSFSPRAAALQGINVHGIYLITFSIACAVAGLAGGLIAPSYGVQTDMGVDIALPVVLITMLGGMDSLLGAVLGGLVLGITLSFGSYYVGSMAQIILYLIIAVIIFFRPQGLLGHQTDMGL